MCGYDGHRGWVYYLAVSTQYRSQGIGRALMDSFEAQLLTLGCPKIQLIVRDSNHSVIEFYERLGYTDNPVKVFGKRLIPDD